MRGIGVEAVLAAVPGVMGSARITCPRMFIGRSVHPLPGEAELKERLLSLIDGFSNRRVLVVGDLIADEFSIYGKVARVSRGAPVLILEYHMTEMVAGGAGNAANNVAALGGRAWLAGIVGADGEATRLLASLHDGVDHRHVEHDRKSAHAREDTHSRRRRALGQTAGGPHQSGGGLALAGGGEPCVCSKADVGARRLRCGAAVRLRIGSRDAGACRRRSREAVETITSAARAGLIDSRYRLLDFKGLTACTPNQSEVEQALGIDIGTISTRSSGRAGHCSIGRR